MLTARRLRVRQAEAEAAGQPAHAASHSTEITRREHEAALWELKKQHAADLEKLRGATTAGDTGEIERLKRELAELEKQNNELQGKLETLAKQEQQLEAPGADTTPTDREPGAAPFGVTKEGAPLAEQNQAPAAAPLDNKGDDKLVPGKPEAAPAPAAPPAAPDAPVAPSGGQTQVLPTATPEAKAEPKPEPKGGTPPPKKK